MNRRQAIGTIATATTFTSRGGAAVPAVPADTDYLLITKDEIEAVKDKAKRLAWARAALDHLLNGAASDLAKPLDIPNRGGQWGHWYACKKDGARLVTESSTRHRCPRCGAVYTGEPYDSVALTWVHANNSRMMRDFGLAFRFTGREEYARRAGEMLAAYADRYLSLPRRDPDGKDTVNSARVMSQTLDESTWLIPIAWAYSLVRETLSAAERRRIERNLFIGATDTIIGTSYPRLPNIQCWKDAAIALTGFALGNQDLIAEALDHPVRGYRILMSKFVLPGGMWWEGSLGYHHYTLNALWYLAEAARRHGLDFYENEHYRSMFDAPIALAMPDGSPPGFNDNHGYPLPAYSDLYEIAYARWKRPEYGAVAAMGKRDSLVALLYGADALPVGLDVIPHKSVLMKEAGVAVMRSPQAAVAVRFGLHGSGHGHPDKLNIVTYGAGCGFGVDPGSIGYGVPLFFEWYKRTVSHNTVSVDEGDQTRADGEFIGWKSDDAAGMTELSASASRVYPGVILRRTLRLENATLHDRFECESDSEHTYDWLFHATGTLTTSLNMTPRSTPVGQSASYRHIAEAREASSDGDWTARWENNGAVLTVTVKGAPGTVVISGIGPGREGTSDVPLILVRRRGAKTAFEVTHVFSGHWNGAPQNG
jgi:oligo-alginate lyase